MKQTRIEATKVQSYSKTDKFSLKESVLFMNCSYMHPVPFIPCYRTLNSASCPPLINWFEQVKARLSKSFPLNFLWIFTWIAWEICQNPWLSFVGQEKKLKFKEMYVAWI